MQMMKIDSDAFDMEGCTLVLSGAEESRLLSEAERECFPLDPWSERMFRDALENEGCRIYSLYNSQMTKIFAYGVVYICLDEADIANIAVTPTLRRKGIGGALLDRMLEECRNMGVSRTFLEVRESNTVARELYRSRLFEEIGKRRKYYRNPCEDAIIMVREEK